MGTFSLIFFYIFSFILLFIPWIFVKNTVLQKNEIKNQLATKNRTARNGDVFINALLKQGKTHIQNNSLFILGNKNSDFELTIFTSLHCEICKNLIATIQKIIFAYEEQIKINLYLKSYHPQMNDLHAFYSIFLFQGQKNFLESLIYWYENKKLFKITDGYDSEIHKPNLEMQNDSFPQNNIISTPAIFINEYAYPPIFEKEDLYYYAENIIENNINLKTLNYAS
ncbi:MAG: hypothetical protein LBE36_12310 [Flavobacteriaceae bacterium]|jgi:hypothetical protein|nr:hypothetical protein [Flavobacteriaceae bacterium]